jgi:hypothetical protein
MLHHIPGTQLSCYLGPAPWSEVEGLAHELLGPEADVASAPDPTLDLHSPQAHFRVERYALRPDRYPWTYLAQMTLTRDPSPLDAWQQVQFARWAALRTHATAYCDIPEEVAVSTSSFYWQLQLQPLGQEIKAAIAQFEELDEDLFCLRNLKPVDLRNFELYQTPLRMRE